MALVYGARFADKDDSHHIISLAERTDRARIVSAGPDDNSWDQKTNKQSEMDLWLGPKAVKLAAITVTLNKRDSYGFISVWTGPTPSEATEWKPLAKDVQLAQSPPPLRFCGWNPVYESLRPRASNSTSATTSANESHQQSGEQVKLRVQFAFTNHSLLDICTQELFAALTISLTALLDIPETIVVENDGNLRLDNPLVSDLAKAFEEGGLGSHSDALLCIIPAVGSKLDPLTPDIMLPALIQKSQTYRRESEWERAEILLRWACERYSQLHDQEEGLTPTVASGSSFITRALPLVTCGFQ